MPHLETAFRQIVTAHLAVRLGISMCQGPGLHRTLLLQVPGKGSGLVEPQWQVVPW